MIPYDMYLSYLIIAASVVEESGHAIVVLNKLIDSTVSSLGPAAVGL